MNTQNKPDVGKVDQDCVEGSLSMQQVWSGCTA
jgi:hypothetical protein